MIDLDLLPDTAEEDLAQEWDPEDGPLPTPSQSLIDLINLLENEHYGLSEDEYVVKRKEIIETLFYVVTLIATKEVNCYAIYRTNFVEEYNEEVEAWRKLWDYEYEAIRKVVEYEITHCYDY